MKRTSIGALLLSFKYPEAIIIPVGRLNVTVEVFGIILTPGI